MTVVLLMYIFDNFVNWGGDGEKGQEDEYSANIVYTCMQMQKLYLLKVFQKCGEEGIKESSGGGEFKNAIFSMLNKCHTIKNEKRKSWKKRISSL
jgi:hypothetical protein